MFEIIAHPERNRVCVTLRGHLDPAERKAAAKAFLAAVNQLGSGFDIIHDLTELRPTDAEGLKDLIRIQAAAKIKGVRSVIRIAKIPLTRLQFERIAEETGWAFETASSLEEAHARLDALGPAPGPEEPQRS